MRAQMQHFRLIATINDNQVCETLESFKKLKFIEFDGKFHNNQQCYLFVEEQDEMEEKVKNKVLQFQKDNDDSVCQTQHSLLVHSKQSNLTSKRIQAAVQAATIKAELVHYEKDVHIEGKLH